MVTRKQLCEWEKVKISDMEKSSLVDIDNVCVDPTMPVQKRLEHYLLAIKNPYLFLCNGKAVKISYSSHGRPLEETLRAHLLHQIS